MLALPRMAKLLHSLSNEGDSIYSDDCTVSKFVGDFCFSTIDMHWWGIAIEVVVFIYVFGCLAIAADHLCNAMETLCSKLKIREDVGGATFMAFGGAIPEICVNFICSIQQAASGSGTGDGQAVNLGIGAILGSGMIAFFIITSTCIIFSHKGELILKRRPLMRDVAAYLFSLGLLMCVIYGHTIYWFMGVLFFIIYLAFIASLLLGRRARKMVRRIRGRSPLVSVGNSPNVSVHVDHENDEEKAKPLKDVVFGIEDDNSMDTEHELKDSMSDNNTSVIADSRLEDTERAILNNSNNLNNMEDAQSLASSAGNTFINGNSGLKEVSHSVSNGGVDVAKKGDLNRSASSASTAEPSSPPKSGSSSSFATMNSEGSLGDDSFTAFKKSDSGIKDLLPITEESCAFQRVKDNSMEVTEPTMSTQLKHSRASLGMAENLTLDLNLRPLDALSSDSSESEPEEIVVVATQDEGDDGLLTTICTKYIWRPVIALTEVLCPDCSMGSGKEKLYPVTFLSALLLIAIFSAIVTNVVDRWVLMIGGNGATLGFLGVVLVATGAEIPDCIQSVQAARRGLGSMAISSCLGSQTLNICIGLGLPWFIVACTGNPIQLSGTGFLETMSACNLVSITFFGCCTFGFAIVTGKGRVLMNKTQAFTFLGVYCVIVLLLGILVFSGHFDHETALSSALESIFM